MLEYTTTITSKSGKYTGHVYNTKTPPELVFTTAEHSIQGEAAKEANTFIESRLSTVFTSKDIKAPSFLNTIKYESQTGTIPVAQNKRCCGRR
jgi:hypothetical protein